MSHQNLVGGLRGHNYDKPMTAIREYLDGIDGAPYTAQRPRTPARYVLAALRPKMLGLSGDRTEGAHTYFVTPEHTAQAREILGSAPLLAPEQAVILETDPVKARELGRRHSSVYLSQPNYVNSIKALGFTEEDFADGGTDAFVDALVAWGDVDAVLSRVQAHLDAGADHVAVQVLSSQKRTVPAEQWRALAEPLTSLNR